MKTQIEILDYLHKNPKDSTFPLEFVIYDGYIALPAVMCLFHPGKNPLFGNMIDCHMSARLFGKLNINGRSKNLRYRKTRHWSGPKISIFSGYFTVIASPDDFNYMSSRIFGNQLEVDYRMIGMVDIFCLGLVKITDLPNVINNRDRYIPYPEPQSSISIATKVNIPSMKIVVSTEKLRKTAFTNENYTKTFRREIIYELERVQRMYGITIEDVSDDYIQNFFRQPHVYSTTSIVEAIRIDSQIKEEVFSKLNELVI